MRISPTQRSDVLGRPALLQNASSSRRRTLFFFLLVAAPIFIWGICTHRWLLLHSCNMCYMPCSRRNINSPGTGWLGIEGYGGSITDSELDLSEENTNRIETKTTHSFTAMVDHEVCGGVCLEEKKRRTSIFQGIRSLSGIAIGLENTLPHESDGAPQDARYGPTCYPCVCLAGWVRAAALLAKLESR
jgi:hypothetical protein